MAVESLWGITDSVGITPAVSRYEDHRDPRTCSASHCSGHFCWAPRESAPINRLNLLRVLLDLDRKVLHSPLKL